MLLKATPDSCREAARGVRGRARTPRRRRTGVASAVLVLSLAPLGGVIHLDGHDVRGVFRRVEAQLSSVGALALHRLAREAANSKVRRGSQDPQVEVTITPSRAGGPARKILCLMPGMAVVLESLWSRSVRIARLFNELKRSDGIA
jgi:hypothetical protein